MGRMTGALTSLFASCSNSQRALSSQRALRRSQLCAISQALDATVRLLVGARTKCAGHGNDLQMHYGQNRIQLMMSAPKMFQLISFLLFFDEIISPRAFRVSGPQ
jgi:hypothetical protein